MRILLIAIAAVLVAARPGARAGTTVEQPADTLQARPRVRGLGRRALRSPTATPKQLPRAQISDRGRAGPLYIAILRPPRSRRPAGASEGALRELADRVGEPGVYAAVIGNWFTPGRPRACCQPARRAGWPARAFDKRDGGTAAVLSDFVWSV